MKRKIFVAIMVALMVTSILGAVLKKPVIEPAITAAVAVIDVNYSMDTVICKLMGHPHKHAEFGDCFKMARDGYDKHDIMFEYAGHR